MTKLRGRQKVAIASPCARAPEVLEGKFRALQEVRGLLLSSILTVNK